MNPEKEKKEAGLVGGGRINEESNKKFSNLRFLSFLFYKYLINIILRVRTLEIMYDGILKKSIVERYSEFSYIYIKLEAVLLYTILVKEASPPSQSFTKDYFFLEKL